MNECQRLWWRQARSDHEVFLLLRREGVAPCHLLHYLQMATEKLAKAYLWGSGSPPPSSHACFVQFLRYLGHIRQGNRERIANLFTFSRYRDFQNWLRRVLEIAYELERLAPALAAGGPNPEYPWPHSQPEAALVDHRFAVWQTLTTGQGRNLMRVIHLAIERFPEYADI